MRARYSGTTIISKIINSLLLPVAAIGYYKYFFAPNKPVTTIGYIVGGTIFILLAVIVANLKYLDEKWDSVVLFLKDKDLVYGYIKMKVEYLDRGGKRVAWEREDFVSSVSIKAKKQLEAIPLNVSGQISKSETTAVNASFSFDESAKHVLFSSKKENRIKNGTAFYSTVLLNTFIEPTEHMDFDVKNFCKFYRLEIIIPKGKQISNYNLLKKENWGKQDSEIFWTNVSDGRVLKTFSLKKTSIIAFVENLYPMEEYRFEWTVV